MLNKNSERELAYVVTVDAIEPIPGKDRVECARVKGWTCMVPKGAFKAGDPGIYFEIDSLVPVDKDPFKFCEKYKGHIKTQKFKNPDGSQFWSQGLLMAAKDFGWTIDRIDTVFITDDKMVRHIPGEESAFLTKQLGITYYEPEDQKRKASSSSDKYKKMTQRHPNLFKNNALIKWLYKRDWGKKLLFFFLGKKKDIVGNEKFPTGVFNGVSITDQERCLVGRTKVMTDIGEIQISKIVNCKLPVKVLSVNKNGQLEYKPIVDYQKYKNNEELLDISFYKYAKGKRIKDRIICSKDHPFYIDNNYITADKLQIGDKIVNYSYGISENKIGAIYGLLLGDGCITFDKRSNAQGRLTWTQSYHHQEYLSYIKELVPGAKEYKMVSGYATSINPIGRLSWDIDYNLNHCLEEDGCIINKHKTITSSFCKRLTPLGIALWYMDDGSNHKNKKTKYERSTIATNAYTKQENEYLKEALKKYNIDVSIKKEKNKYWYLSINGNEFKKLTALIGKYVPPCMRYKLHSQVESLYPFDFDYENIAQKEESLVTTEILDIKPFKKFTNGYGSGSYIYDIEVEDNHNFFANSILTHNCENMTWILKDKTPFVITQKCDGSSGTYILEKKKGLFGVRYEFYVCSRNIRLSSPKQQTYYDKNYYWEVAEKYDIYNKMKDYIDNHNLNWICWQGEICAPGIQKNPHNLNETHFYCFHWTDSSRGRLDIREAKKEWDQLNMEVVPIIGECVLPDDFEEFKLSADGYYDPSVCEGNDKCPREGFVYYKTTDPTFSFKNVSREYLEKHK